MNDLSFLTREARVEFLYKQFRALAQQRVNEIESGRREPTPPFQTTEQEYYENLNLLTLTMQEFINGYTNTAM